MSAEILDTVDEIFANANRLVAGVADGQWHDQTPCSEWDVRQLVNHTTGTTKFFAAIAARSEASGDPDADHLGDDPAAAFAAASEATAAAWRVDGALDGMVSQPLEMPASAAIGILVLDVGTHCWDIAEATGQDHGLSDSAIATIDACSRQIVSDEIRSRGGFGDVLEPSSDDALTTMLAFLGRRA
ncbi:MAG: TIGR03086 family metal-binding protein [Acidimicrobiia bacterium]|nr:TIGR03086 family metal-binding protein [Acidimicrobiia bacterium]